MGLRAVVRISVGPVTWFQGWMLVQNSLIILADHFRLREAEIGSNFRLCTSFAHPELPGGGILSVISELLSEALSLFTVFIPTGFHILYLFIRDPFWSEGSILRAVPSQTYETIQSDNCLPI